MLKKTHIILFIFIFFNIHKSFGDIYFFIDKEGVKHYTDYPVHDGYEKIYSDRESKKQYQRSKSKASMKEINNLVKNIASDYQVDPDLVKAVIRAESSFDSFAVSPKGAVGLMQLMPGTAARFYVENAFDPEQNIKAGVLYLKELLNLYNGNLDYSLAAYNAGEKAVYEYVGIPPYKETINYVKKVKDYYVKLKKSRSDPS